jgi:hypothetical protein
MGRVEEIRGRGRERYENAIKMSFKKYIMRTEMTGLRTESTGRI